MLSIQRSRQPHRSLKQEICVLLFLVGATGCVSTHSSSETLLDLTYPFDEHTIYWPNNTPFHWQKLNWGHTHRGYWYASAVFSASEHGGTHIDAPIHFSEFGRSVDEIPLSHLRAQAIVLDIRTQADENHDYLLQIEDIVEWEKQHGPIPSESIVFLLTGWGQYWPDPSRYLGSLTPEDTTTLHFPGFSGESISFLVEQRSIFGIGIDTASIDRGQSQSFEAHQVLGQANCFALENVAHLEKLPPQGAMVTALPMKIQGGTGAPTRVIALVPSTNPSHK